MKAVATAGFAALFLSQPLIAQAAACRFSVVPSANPVADNNDLLGVSATAATDAWAVGYYLNTSSIYASLTEHWTGTAWSVVTSPNPGSIGNVLYAVSALSSSDAWAVGYYNPDNFHYAPLIEHWNGSAWSVIPSPRMTTSLMARQRYPGPTMRGAQAASTTPTVRGT